MKKATDSKLLFEISNSQEEKMLRDLHDYFDGMFFAN
jgi:hypothetical protein